jgi:uncharacterized protein
MSKSKINNKKDILLLLLYTNGVSEQFNEPIKGRTRLVKLLFLFHKEGLLHFKAGTDIKENEFYTFFPWFYGPFSQQIYDDVNFFQMRDFIELKDVESDNVNISYEEAYHYSDITDLSSEQLLDRDSFVEQEISLTEKGKIFAAGLYSDLTETQKSLLKQFKKKFNSTPLKAILRYVYKTYPETTENSIIKDNIVGDD